MSGDEEVTEVAHAGPVIDGIPEPADRVSGDGVHRDLTAPDGKEPANGESTPEPVGSAPADESAPPLPDQSVAGSDVLPPPAPPRSGMSHPSAEANLLLNGYVDRYERLLGEQASILARKGGADRVSPEFVRRAAEIIDRDMNSAVSDIFLGLGASLSTSGASVAATLALTDSAISDWLVAGTAIGSAVGLLMTGAGITMKVLRRR